MTRLRSSPDTVYWSYLQGQAGPYKYGLYTGSSGPCSHPHPQVARMLEGLACISPLGLVFVLERDVSGSLQPESEQVPLEMHIRLHAEGGQAAVRTHFSRSCAPWTFTLLLGTSCSRCSPGKSSKGPEESSLSLTVFCGDELYRKCFIPYENQTSKA